MPNKDPFYQEEKNTLDISDIGIKPLNADQNTNQQNLDSGNTSQQVASIDNAVSSVDASDTSVAVAQDSSISDANVALQNQQPNFTNVDQNISHISNNLEHSTDPKTSADPFMSSQLQTNQNRNIVKSSDNTLTTTKPQPNTQVVSKQGSKISAKGFMIGCGVFFVIFVGLVMGGLWIALRDPQVLQGFGLEASTIKSLLQLFAILFFGILFFVGFAISALNGFRMATIKEGSKIKYILGLVLGILLLLSSIVLGTISISSIGEISSNSNFVAGGIVAGYIEVKPKAGSTDPLADKLYIGTPGLKLIAPTNVHYQFNLDTFRKNVLAGLGNNIKLSYISLNCGSGQKIDGRIVGFNNANFRTEPCFYTTKGNYDLSIEYGYTDANNNLITASLPVGSINIASQLNITDPNGKTNLNEKLTEIIAGINPAKVLINAQNVFTDLSIPSYNILRDMDANGSIDKTDKTNFSYYYQKPQLYTVYYNIPGLNKDLYYSFKLRVNPGDVPGCNISTNMVSEDIYRFTTMIDDNTTDISSYRFEIIDVSNDDVVKTIDQEKNIFEYQLGAGKTYRVRAFFTTTEGKNGLCESNDIDINNAGYQIVTTFFKKGPESEKYTKYEIDGQNNSIESQIVLEDIPTMLRFKIDKTIPQASSPNYEVKVANNQISPSSAGIYTIKIDNLDAKKLVIQVSDDKGKKSTKSFDISIKKKNTVAKLKVDKIVGFEPLTVKFDASISKLNDPDDEIVYFTRDFGDGQILKNVSQGKMSHTYQFDKTKESGEYKPKITIQTKKGYTDTANLDTSIIVKRQLRTVKISSESHPAQSASVGDQVKFAISTDGQVKSISRDYGNDKTTSCENRECIETVTSRDKPGLYEVQATVEYMDHPPVTQSINIRVE